jgi:hypothetical protein
MEHFEARIEQAGSKAYIRLPFDPNEAWGVKDRHHVNGRINSIPVRGPLSMDGDVHVFSLGPAWLRDSGIRVGDLVVVEIAPEGPQLETLPKDVASALHMDAEARSFFESLATFYRKGYLRWIEGARKPETRAQRIAEMVRLLKAGKKQR